MDGRKEKRTPCTLRVLLSSGLQPIVAEYASTENLSFYGVRLRTERPWRPDTRVLIRSSQGQPWASARMVCCQTLKSRMFALGLEFLTRTSDWRLLSVAPDHRPRHALGGVVPRSVCKANLQGQIAAGRSRRGYFGHSASIFSMHGMKCSGE